MAKKKTLADVLKEIAEEDSSDIDKALKGHDKFTDEKYQAKILVGLQSGQAKMYNTTVSSLDKAFEEHKGDDTKLLQKHKKTLKKAVGEGLLDYFKEQHPAILKGAEHLKDDELHDHLITQYDRLHQGSQQDRNNAGIPLRALIDSAVKNKQTLAEFKATFYNIGSQNARAAQFQLNQSYTASHLGKHLPHLPGHIVKGVEKAGFEVKEDHLTDMQTADLDTLLNIRKSYIKGEAHDYIQKKKKK